MTALCGWFRSQWTWRMAAAAVGSAFLSVTTANSFEYPSTCRGAGVTVTELTGLDSRVAVMSGKSSEKDAVAYCQRSTPFSTCVARFMRDRAKTSYLAQADCEAGTLSTVAMGLPTPEYPQAIWSSAYKFPIPAMCAGDNNQAIEIFKILCPSYRGRIEEQQR